MSNYDWIIRKDCSFHLNLFNYHDFLWFQNDPLFAEYADLQTTLGYCDDMLLESTDRIVVSPGVPLEEYGLSNLMHSVSSPDQHLFLSVLVAFNVVCSCC